MVPASSIKVLVVEDELSGRALMRRSLQHLGFTHIYDAKDPVEGLPIAASNRVHLIISDYLMPRMNGLQFGAAVREHPILAAAGFVLVSGVVEASVVAQAVDASVDSVIRKPFSIADLKQRVEAVLHRRIGVPVSWGALA